MEKFGTEMRRQVKIASWDNDTELSKGMLRNGNLLMILKDSR